MLATPASSKDRLRSQRNHCRHLLFLVVVGISSAAQGQTASFNLIEATIPDMQSAMDAGLISSEGLVQQYLNRIAAFDSAGPELNSVLSLNPNAIETARSLDAERSASGPRGPLHGIPVLLKDNIDTVEMPTTGGAYALRNSVPPDDAFLANKLREAGAIILGKANLSELANWVSFTLPNGFSAVGGQTLNPYGPVVFDPVGSSTGSAVSVASNLAAAAVGTETLGSIMSPSGWNSAVGIRPTLGLISRDGIIPITHSQDTAGPIARTVTDAAIMLGAMAGVDPNDPATAASEGRIHADYTQFLNADGLQGKRIGVVRHPTLEPDFLFEHTLPIVDRALADMERLGATLVDDLQFGSLLQLFDLWGDGLPGVLPYEFQSGFEKYLATLGADAAVKTLAELIAFNAANAAEAIPFGQDILETSLELGDQLDSPEYLQQLTEGLRLVGSEGFDALLEENNLDALFFTEAWSSFGAVTGYPSISIPAGYDETGFPLSAEFLAGPYSEPLLIEMAYAYEQGTMRRQPPSTAPMIEGDYLGFGDFDGDQRLSVADIDLLAAAIRAGDNASDFDVTGDGRVDVADLQEFVTAQGKMNTAIGDVDLNGWFDSSDLIAIFQAGEYEDGIAGNSNWRTGDWNADGEFDTSDLAFAFQAGGYATLTRPFTATVPEPGSMVLFVAGLLLLTNVKRRLNLERDPTDLQ